MFESRSVSCDAHDYWPLINAVPGTNLGNRQKLQKGNGGTGSLPCVLSHRIQQFNSCGEIQMTKR